MIKNYKNFKLQLLLESILVTKGRFFEIISSLYDKSEIAEILYRIIDNDLDVKTNVNYIDYSDSQNDVISFIPDTQYQRLISNKEDPSTKSKSTSKIGRVVRQILKDNGYNKSDREIEEFVNLFKSTWDFKNGVGRIFEIVKGEDIRYWYLEKNYYKVSGQLGNSCMRYERCQPYLDIYCKNEDKISLVILKFEDKLLGRAILWNLDDGRKYLDRIYTVQDSDYTFFKNWALENISRDLLLFDSREVTMRCTLKNLNLKQWPYSDSLYYVNHKMVYGKIKNEGFVTNSSENHEGYLLREIRQTGGGSETFGWKYSNYYEIYIENSKCTWAADLKSWVRNSDVVHSKFIDSYIFKEKAVYNELVKDWISLEMGEDTPKFGFIYPDMIKKVLVGYKGKFTDPIDIFLDIQNSNEVIEIEEIIDKTGYLRCSLPGVDFVKDDLLVRDYDGDRIINFLCYKIVAIPNDKKEFLKENSVVIISHGYGNRYYILEMDAILYDLPIVETSFYYYDHLINLVSDEGPFKIANQTKKIITKSAEKEAAKKSKIKLFESIHRYLLENNSYYLTRFKISNFNENKSEDEVIKDSIEIFQMAWDKNCIESTEKNIIIRSCRQADDGGLERINLNKLDDFFELLIKYSKLVNYFYVYLRWNRPISIELTIKWISKFGDEKEKEFVQNYESQLIDNLRRIIYYRTEDYLFVDVPWAIGKFLNIDQNLSRDQVKLYTDYVRLALGDDIISNFDNLDNEKIDIIKRSLVEVNE